MAGISLATGSLVRVGSGLLLLACNPAAVPPSARRQQEQLTFWTDAPALAQPLETATYRLAHATGRAVSVEPDGVPVLSVPEPRDVGGRLTCAVTSVDSDGHVYDIQIDDHPEGFACHSATGTLIHELMHALAPFAPHSETGLFALTANTTSWIDEASLTRLCEYFDCWAFRPE